MKRVLLTFMILLSACISKAQQWQGTRGLLHVPDAEMDSVGELRVGTHVLNKEMLNYSFSYVDEQGTSHRYNTLSYYINATPFSWISFSYVCVLFKYGDGFFDDFTDKDRHFSAKIRILKEKEYLPALAFGMDDVLDTYQSMSKGQYRFGNYYGVATKHFDLWGHQIALTLGYRHYLKASYQKTNNERYNGVVGGVAYRPLFYQDLRFMGEYDGAHVNVGADVKLWKHLYLQFSMMGCKYPSGGICFSHDLFSR